MNHLQFLRILMIIAMDALTVSNPLRNSSFSSASKNGLQMVKLFRNIPHIHLHEKKANKERWHGAEIHVVIEGNWTTYRVRGFYHPFALAYFFRYLCMHSGLTHLISSFSSQRSYTICARWLLLLLMRSFCLDLYQKHPSMISVFLLLCHIALSVHLQHY